MIEAKIERSILIIANTNIVWKHLTDPVMMGKWMGGQEMHIRVKTDWIVGSGIFISGLHHVKFENKGTVLDFKPGKLLRYTHLSSLSRLPENEANYSIISFLFETKNEGTLLALTLERFATETIMKHLDFYWRATIVTLKRLTESS